MSESLYFWELTRINMVVTSFLISRGHSYSQVSGKVIFSPINTRGRRYHLCLSQGCFHSSDIAYSHICHPDSSFHFFECPGLLHTLGSLSLSEYNCPLLLKCKVKKSFSNHSLYTAILYQIYLS